MSAPAKRLGPFGLPYAQVGEVVQAMFEVLRDRGHEREAIIAAIPKLDEIEFWCRHIGPVIDALEEELELPSLEG